LHTEIDDDPYGDILTLLHSLQTAMMGL